MTTILYDTAAELSATAADLAANIAEGRACPGLLDHARDMLDTLAADPGGTGPYTLAPPALTGAERRAIAADLAATAADIAADVRLTGRACPASVDYARDLLSAVESVPYTLTPKALAALAGDTP